MSGMDSGQHWQPPPPGAKMLPSPLDHPNGASALKTLFASDPTLDRQSVNAGGGELGACMVPLAVRAEFLPGTIASFDCIHFIAC